MKILRLLFLLTCFWCFISAAHLSETFLDNVQGVLHYCDHTSTDLVLKCRKGRLHRGIRSATGKPQTCQLVSETGGPQHISFLHVDSSKITKCHQGEYFCGSCQKYLNGLLHKFSGLIGITVCNSAPPCADPDYQGSPVKGEATGQNPNSFAATAVTDSGGSDFSAAGSEVTGKTAVPTRVYSQWSELSVPGWMEAVICCFISCILVYFLIASAVKLGRHFNWFQRGPQNNNQAGKNNAYKLFGSR